MAGRRRRGGFRRVEEVAAAAGSLLPRSERGRHLRAMAAWRAAVGPQLQRSTRVAKLDGGLMTVQVSEDAYRNSVKRLEKQILSRFQRAMGKDAPQRIQVEVSHGFWRPPQGPMRSSRNAPQWQVAEDAAESSVGGENAAGGLSGGVPEAPCAKVAEPLTAQDVECIQDPDQRERLLEVANRYLARAERRTGPR